MIGNVLIPAFLRFWNIFQNRMGKNLYDGIGIVVLYVII